MERGRHALQPAHCSETPAHQARLPAPDCRTAVQHECIPQAILGMDVICQAKSGMGKTAVFVISSLQQLEPVDGQARWARQQRRVWRACRYEYSSRQPVDSRWLAVGVSTGACRVGNTYTQAGRVPRRVLLRC